MHIFFYSMRFQLLKSKFSCSGYFFLDIDKIMCSLTGLLAGYFWLNAITIYLLCSIAIQILLYLFNSVTLRNKTLLNYIFLRLLSRPFKIKFPLTKAWKCFLSNWDCSFLSTLVVTSFDRNGSTLSSLNTRSTNGTRKWYDSHLENIIYIFALSLKHLFWLSFILF